MIPAMGVVCGGAGIALGMTPAVALVGAALAGCVRVLAGDAPAAVVGAIIAPALAVASFAEVGGASLRAAVALAAAAWAVIELVRAEQRWSVAALPAVVAAVLDPAFVALVAIAGAQMVATGQTRARPATLAVAVAGALALALAVIAAVAWPALGNPWFGRAAHPIATRAWVALAGAVLGPVTAVAALGGLLALARGRAGEIAVAAALAGAIGADLRGGAVGAATIGLAALLAGLATARLAGMIRLRAGQGFAALVIGAVIVVPPAWTAALQRAPFAHTGHASR